MAQTVEPVRAYHIDALAAEGFTRRAIRWYIEIGVLPPPHGKGRAAFYDETHIAILRRIAKWKDEKRELADVREEARAAYRRAFARSGAKA